MKNILLAAAVTVIAAGSAHAAPSYPWCQRTKITGGSPDCSFTSFRQCQASISGVGGDCIRNPSLAYGGYPRKSGDRFDRRR